MPDYDAKDSRGKDPALREFFFREGSRYSEAQLKEAFGGGILSENLINRLRARKIIRCGNELFDGDPDDLDVASNDMDKPYGMRFVGVAVCGSRVIYSVPKYEGEPSGDELTSDAEARKELTGHLLDVVTAVVKSGELKGTEQSEEGREEPSDNYLPIAFALISDYYENGLYVNERIETRQNLDGEILWDKTVNELSPIWVRGRPCYFDVFARKRRVNEEDFFTRLHQCVLSEITSKISGSGIEEFIDRLGYPLPDVVSESEMLEFGDDELVISRINQELAIQFNTRKQEQLKLMCAYVNRRSQLRRSEFGLLGTCSFHTVWEKACKTVFGDQMEMAIKSRDLKLAAGDSLRGVTAETPLGQYIENPIWKIIRNDHAKDDQVQKEKNTLRPDCLRIKKGEDGYFDIIDAKYYLIKCDKNGRLSGNPGVGDVTKQFLYDYEYRPLLKVNGIPLDGEHIFNCFLVPRDVAQNNGLNEEVPKVDCFGEVNMPWLQSLDAEAVSADAEETVRVRKLPSIQVWKISARWLLSAYNTGNWHLKDEQSISEWLRDNEKEKDE